MKHAIAGIAGLLVAGVLGLVATPASAAMNPAQAISGINAGNGPTLVTGPDGSNLALFSDRDTKVWSTAYRKVGENRFDGRIAVPNAAGMSVSTNLTVAIADDLTQIAASNSATPDFSSYKFTIWRKSAAATSWPVPVVISQPNAAAYAASTAVLPDGSVQFAWNDTATKQVNVARVAPGGSTLGAVQKVGEPGKGGAPRIVVGRGGHTLLWWQVSGTTDLATSMRTSPGGTFGAAQIVPRSTSETELVNPAFAVGDAGRSFLVAAVRPAQGQPYDVHAWERPAAGAWGDGTNISGSGYDNGFPKIGVSGSDSVVVAYEVAISDAAPGTKVEVTTKDGEPGSFWTPPQTVSPTSASYSRPVVAVGEDGAAIVAWDLSDGMSFDDHDPGTTYLSAHVSQASYRLVDGAGFGPSETVSVRRANDGAVAATAGSGSVVTGWFESTQFNTPYGAMVTTSGPAGVATSTMTVNSTADRPATNGGQQGCRTGQFVAGKPECTLRAAIQAVNANQGNEIDFDIAVDGGGAPTIDVASALPELSKTATIDGTTQPGGMVEVLASGVDGLTVSGPGSVIRGLALAGFTGPTLVVTGAGTKVTGNKIGTDATGTQYRQTASGIVVALGANVTIGGDTAAEGNQIVTGPDGVGVYLIADPTHPASGLVVRHNTIGLDAAGGSTLGAGPAAAVIVLGVGPAQSTISDNLVTGATLGIGVFGAGAADSTIKDNTVGTDRAQTAREGAPLMGIRSDGAARTTISSNVVAAKGWDVVVSGSIQGSFTADSYTLYPPNTAPVTAPVTGGGEKVIANRVGVFGDGTLVPGSGSDGITVWGGASSTQIQQNVVAGHTSAEIYLVRGKDHRVLRNEVGLDPEGDSILGGTAGIVASATPGIVIGDSNTTGNRIGGMLTNAILINGLTREAGGAGKVVGNAIGLLADGVTPAPSDGGITVTDAPKTTIGPDNVIANNRTVGVSLSARSAGSTVTGNWIGLTAYGTAKAPNGLGVSVSAPSGSDPLQVAIAIHDNTISGNEHGGVLVAGGGGVSVAANRFGVSPTGMSDLGNGGSAVVVNSDGGEIRDNVVGWSADGGIAAGGKDLAITGNQVGQPAGAETDIGNHGDGIEVEGSGKVTDNVVANNGGNGIHLSSSAKVEVRKNRIASNDGSGILTQSTSGSILRDNRIGLAAATDAARPNDVGVEVIGGKVVVKSNRIGASTHAAIDVAPGATATLTSNPLFGSGGPKAIVAPTPSAPVAPTLGFAVRKGTGDAARTWLQLLGPDDPGTFEAFGNVDCSDPEAKVPMATGSWKGGTTPSVLTVRGRPDLLGYTVTFTSTASGKTSELSSCATVDTAASDGDGDAIPTIVEEASPWDDAPGSAKFVAVPSDAGGWVGLRDADDPFKDVTPVDAPDAKPAGLELPFGLLSFTITLGAPGQFTDVDLFVSGVSAGDHYWKYGPDEGAAPSWYRFDYREKPAGVPGFFERTGAKRTTFTIGGEPYAGYTIRFDDGLRGDDATTKDGVIRDPGGGATGGVDDRECPSAPGNERYVCRAYQFGLGRAPDPSGLAFWVKRLDRGLSRSSVMASFISSAEARRVVVRRLYSTYLHRSPDPSGLAYWSGKLGTGTKPETLRISLLSSAEHLRRSGATDRDWVGALYTQVARRAATDAEVDAMLALLDGGASRPAVAASVLRSTEGRATVVAETYELYLQRTPASTETRYWQDQLAAGLSELKLDISTVASNEFFRG